MFITACRYPFTLRAVSSEEASEVVDAAQESILRNMLVVKHIADVNEDDLRFFFESVQLYEYSYEGWFSPSFRGMSSFDGSRIYLDKTTMKPPKMELWDQQKLEHQYMLCLSCWGKFDPYLVTSWSNPNLRSLKHPNATLGAGHFYEERVYQKIMAIPSPFQLDGPYEVLRG